MIAQPIRMEGLIPILSLILINLKFIVEQLKKKFSSPIANDSTTTTQNELSQKCL